MAKATIRHLIWDWNGTLLDDVDACVQAINAMLLPRALPPLDCASYRELFGFPVKNYYRALGFDLDAEDWDAMATEFHEFYAIAAADAGLHDGARQSLDAFRRDGLPMSVLSASELSILERMLCERGIRDFFQHVCGLGDLYAHSKLEAGRELVQRLGLCGEELLLIGDTIHDYDVARELDCRCVLVEGGHQAAHRLARCNCPVVAAFGQIPDCFEFLPAV